MIFFDEDNRIYMNTCDDDCEACDNCDYCDNCDNDCQGGCDNCDSVNY